MYNILIHDHTHSKTIHPCVYVSLKPTSTSSASLDSEVIQPHDPGTLTKTQPSQHIPFHHKKPNSPSLNPRSQILLIYLTRPKLIPKCQPPRPSPSPRYLNLLSTKTHPFNHSIHLRLSTRLSYSRHDHVRVCVQTFVHPRGEFEVTG